MITLSNVTKKYSNGHIGLNNISLQIATGEMVFLQGHSGAGKSTLLKLIALLERPSGGQIIVNNQNINHIPAAKIPFYRRQLGFICQHPKLLNNDTIFDNVAIPLIILGFSKQDIQRRVHAALERVGLIHKAHYLPSALSEGEQQRVGIARAVVHKPRVLIADEPTGNLDPVLSLEIMQLFERFHQAGVTVVIASHDNHLLEAFPYRKLYIANGQLLHLSDLKTETLSTELEMESEYA